MSKATYSNSTIVEQATEPTNRGVLWADTSEPLLLTNSGGELLDNGSFLGGWENWQSSYNNFTPVNNFGYGPYTSMKFEGSNLQVSFYSKKLIPVNSEGTYLYTGFIYASAGDTSRNYMAVVPCDADGNLITPYMGEPGRRQSGTKTTLASPLNVGDSTIQLTNGASWSEIANRGVIVFPYTNSQGISYANYTYSRHAQVNNFTVSGNTITLVGATWNVANPATQDGSWPAGTPVEETASGGSFLYPDTQLFTSSSSWRRFEGYVGRGTTLPFWYGTEYVKPSWLLNYESPTTQAKYISNCSFTRINAASESTLTLATYWVDYGPPYDGQYVTRAGNVVTIDCLMKRSTPLSGSINNGIVVGTLPEGLRPKHQSIGLGLINDTVQSTGYETVRVDVFTSGQVSMTPIFRDVAFDVGGWLAINMSFRAA